ncbi:MAG: hypothetical protein HZB77_03095 [Chloroflexi bacterium]|nr:hypothetical protein [Chloroflexota bacterium]
MAIRVEVGADVGEGELGNDVAGGRVGVTEVEVAGCGVAVDSDEGAGVDVGVTPSASARLEGKRIVAAITITLNNRINAAVLLI